VNGEKRAVNKQLLKQSCEVFDEPLRDLYVFGKNVLQTLEIAGG